MQFNFSCSKDDLILHDDGTDGYGLIKKANRMMY